MRVVEAVGAACDRAGLAVESLDAAFVQSRRDVANDSLDMSLDGLGELAKGLEARAVGPLNPSSQLLAGDVDLKPVENAGQTLLEEVGAIERPVVLLDVGELLFLVDVEVPGILLERKASALDD